jgi:copper chaperone CopZ
MKTSFFALLASAALATMAYADSSVTLSDVHLCCKSCVTGAEKAVATTPGVTAAVDKDAGTIKLTAADNAALQKGVDSLVEAGYFGKSDNAAVTVKADTGAKDGKVTTMTVDGVHLCCDKCAKATKAAVAKAPGVTGDTAAKKVTSFDVTGNFSQKEVMAALQAAGLTGTVK